MMLNKQAIELGQIDLGEGEPMGLAMSLNAFHAFSERCLKLSELAFREQRHVLLAASAPVRFPLGVHSRPRRFRG